MGRRNEEERPAAAKRRKVSDDESMSDEEMSELEGLDDLEVDEFDGEFDDEDFEEGEEEASEDEAEDSEAENVAEGKEKKPKPEKKPNTASFANAIQKILDKPLDSTKKRTNPILAKNTIEKHIDAKKLEAKALKLIAAEKKVQKLSSHVARPGEGDASAIEFEKKLRKVATRGVVRLFNAIRAAQGSVEKVVQGTILKNEKAVPTVTKSTFLKVIEKSTQNNAAKATDQTNQEKEQEAPVEWLKQDFMTKKSTASKHWDEDSVDEEEQETVGRIELM